LLYTFKVSVAKDSEMQSFENRMLQLETKPYNRILENSVQPQEDEGKSPKAFPTAWITVRISTYTNQSRVSHSARMRENSAEVYPKQSSLERSF